MAWEWSFSTEGLQNIRDNIGDMPWSKQAESLTEAYAEIKAYREDREGSHGDFDMPTYDRALQDTKKLPASIVVQSVIDFAFDFRTCDNGGFRAWICPYGCHTVSLDREASNE